jgi:hypothetical protein
MGFLHNLRQSCHSIVSIRVVPFKQLFGSHHDLVGGLASTTAPAHAIGHDGKQTAIHTRMFEQGNLVLLVFAVTLMDASGRGKSVTDGHGGWIAEQYFL